MKWSLAVAVRRAQSKPTGKRSARLGLKAQPSGTVPRAGSFQSAGSRWYSQAAES